MLLTVKRGIGRGRRRGHVCRFRRRNGRMKRENGIVLGDVKRIEEERSERKT